MRFNNLHACITACCNLQWLITSQEHNLPEVSHTHKEDELTYFHAPSRENKVREFTHTKK